MFKSNILASLLIASLLTACGGGGDSSTGGGTSGGSGGGSGGGGGGNNTLTFQADVFQETQCGTRITSNNAELLIHDQDWRVVSRHRADATGKISASVTGMTTANISVITFSASSGPGNDFIVNSYAQHPVGSLGTIVVPGRTQQGCECVSANVLVQSPFGGLTTSETVITGIASPEQRKTAVSFNEVLFENVGLCRVAAGAWPLLAASANRGSAQSIAGSVRQYDVTNTITLLMDRIPNVVPVSLNSASAFLSETHYTENGLLSGRTRTNSSEVYAFNSLDGIRFIMVRAADNQFNAVSGGSILRSTTQRDNVLAPLTQPTTLTLPNSDAQQALETFLLRDLPSDNINYNLGTVQGFNTFYLYAQITLTDGTRYFQSFIGPLQGKYPDEVVPADYGIDARLNENASTTVYAGVIRYGDSQTYNQFLQEQVERSNLPFESRMTGKWAKYSTVSVQITTSP